MQTRLTLDVRALHHVYPGPVPVLFDVNLAVARGQIVSLVGPSGCGKSTLLNIILGTLRATSGAVVTLRRAPGGAGSLIEQVVTGPGRDRGIVYQRYALYPHLTALENVAIGLRFDQTSALDRTLRYLWWRRKRREHLDIAAAMLERVGLGHAMHKHPHELSGGMQQRVAIAQALVMEPSVMLLDEPFGALDEATREDLQGMLLGFYAENIAARQRDEDPRYTIVIVTHELNEAIYVGDRVVGLSQYWDWRAEGHARSPGATIVYDKPAPVHDPSDLREHADFVAQRDEIRRIVFDPGSGTDRKSHVVFWERSLNGDPHGVLAH